MQLKVLDCTLRDGGQGLEDFQKNGIPTDHFTLQERVKIAENARDAGIDIIEVGCIGNFFNEDFAIYPNLERLSLFVPERKNKEQMFVGLYIDPDHDLESIPDRSESMVDGIRVILRYSELQKSLNFCAGLAKKGYQVFVQPMLTMRYTDVEIDSMIAQANDMGAYALYFVDSYGYMTETDIKRLYEHYDRSLNPYIYIGFHAHNNMQAAFPNVRYFIEQFGDRKRIVDACAVGMGQGAGNMATEMLLHYLIQKGIDSYQLEPVLDNCDILDKFRHHDMEMWGYSPIRFVSAINKAAYKYAVAMKLQHHLSLREINRIFQLMPVELKHRYTPDNLKKVLNNYRGL